jgi:hypothetical protein
VVSCAAKWNQLARRAHPYDTDLGLFGNLDLHDAHASFHKVVLLRGIAYHEALQDVKDFVHAKTPGGKPGAP